jgi:hypothetical protein
MASSTCPACRYENPAKTPHCASCGAALLDSIPPIRRWSGKFSAVGAVIIAIGVIGTVLGTWWGPPTLLPGVAFYMMARFF